MARGQDFPVHLGGEINNQGTKSGDSDKVQVNNESSNLTIISSR